MKVVGQTRKLGLDIIEYQYLCNYCGNVFKKNIVRYEKGTTPAVCPRCKNFLKVDSGE